MPDNITHRANLFDSQIAGGEAKENPNANITARAKLFDKQIAGEEIAIDPNANITARAKLFDQQVKEAIENASGGGNIGFFVPLNMVAFRLPTFSLKYNNKEI